MLERPVQRNPYATDLTDAAWDLIRDDIVPELSGGGCRCPDWKWREYVNAVLYVNRAGGQWRMLPHDFGVGWSHTHKVFLGWERAGTLDRIADKLRVKIRIEHQDRNGEPSAMVADSTSIKSTPVAGKRGYDGGKKVNGIKRHIIVDTMGLLMAVMVTAANVGERAPLIHMIRRVRHRGHGHRVRHMWADSGFRSKRLAQILLRRFGVTIEIVTGPKPKREFVVQPWRWIVERTFAWMQRSRRLTRQYEATFVAHEAMTKISMIALMLRRLDGTPTPP